MTGINATVTVDDVLGQHPDAMRVFIDHGMACIGCAVAPYHTIEEACAEYNLPVEEMLRDLAAAMSASTGKRNA